MTAPYVGVGLFLGILVLLDIGRRIGSTRVARDVERARAGLGAMEGAVFGLLGLLIAFTFSGAASRFDGRRQLITQEANAIGTAWLRLALLPPDLQAPLRDSFRAYLDSRLLTYQKLPDIPAAEAELEHSEQLQKVIWSQSVAACQTPEGQRASMLLLPAINEMIDITATRSTAAHTHPPLIIFGMLITLTLASSLLAGHGMAGSKRRSWLHMIGFAVVLATTVYVIIDIEYPRIGPIQLMGADEVLIELRRSMD